MKEIKFTTEEYIRIRNAATNNAILTTNEWKHINDLLYLRSKVAEEMLLKDKNFDNAESAFNFTNEFIKKLLSL